MYRLPILDAEYPQDVDVFASETGNVSFSVAITEHGRPEQYAYQWYLNGEAVVGAINSNYTLYDLTEIGMKTVYCVITHKAGSITSRAATVTIKDPMLTGYTYGGNHKFVPEDKYNWRIECYTSGKLVVPRDIAVDVYLHGAGGGGGDSANPGGGGGGGGGWFASHFNIPATADTPYDIVIGAGSWNTDGGSSSAFGYSVAGGKLGGNAGWSEGAGGGGGAGGSGNGGNGGGSTGGYGTSGGDNWTYAFNDSSYGLIYGGGGAGGGPKYGGDGAGGKPYGARGSQHAANNTGAGGGGANWTDGEYTTRGKGGSGIVIIRNAR